MSQDLVENASRPLTLEAHSRARRRLPTGVTRQTLAFAPAPLFVQSAAGAYLTDIDGRRYLDCVNNYTSLIHGHAHELTEKAIVRVLRTIGAAPGAASELELELAEILCGRVTSLERVRFALSGSEAVIFALRAARAFTGRPRILKFEGGFHGCADEVQQNIALEPLAPGEARLSDPNGAGLARVDTVVAVYNDLASVERAFAEWGSEIAAVIAEPFLGNVALLPAEPGFLAAVAEIARRHGALFVLDEIQSCRMAVGGLQQLHAVVPDLTLLGKTVAGSLPLAVLGGRVDVMRQFDGFQPQIVQTGTYTGSPIALAAAIVTLAHLDAGAITELNAMGARFREGIAAAFADADRTVRVGGQGSMFNISLIDHPLGTYASAQTADMRGLANLHGALLGKGVYLTQRGTGCLSTPMTDGDLDYFLTALEGALRWLNSR